ncbi:hypothetical protein DB313_04725 (plasmid) [Borrelia turcica IST7]|uniref:Uncharacterized protein n=1 Tax=Borrelia turcica IST7 TaxID=1104446 RepID=A0A386PMK8_9SPIR|nr:hypothetical protein [Borrelia turcica]AYE36806.1 hypothetical protein DB313_04725 [Borrelia turcica IST7]
MNKRTDLISKLKTQVVATESKKSNEIELKTEVEKISDKKTSTTKEGEKGYYWSTYRSNIEAKAI